jgi:cellulose synthase/poly-beta-1,6-N-acetylglucosamine synthase-like glycosyltransferase
MIQVATWFIFGYFILLNGGYLALNLLSIFALQRNKQEKLLEDLPQVFTSLDPGISILVPAYNEETTITSSIRSMFQLTYSNFEIIVINDGSKDRTLEVLKHEFSLLPFPEARREGLTTKPVRGVYRSVRYPNLRVIDKENGGKADSLNAGINAAHHPLFCGVDADSILTRDSLQRVVKPFLDHPDTVATGGTVRVANGCEITDGFLTKVGLPGNIWALFQVVEYLRAFLFGRLGWSRLNAMLIISGAFGLFKTEVVMAVGGYRGNTIGEDMELVVRIHRLLRQQGKTYRIEFVPEPVCWTEAPEDMKTLKNQRIRWQRGLSESLSSNWGLMFSRNGGRPGWLAFPFMVLFEWLGPLVELSGYLFMFVAFFLGLISWQAFTVFLFMAIGLGILLSASGLLLEEISFHTYPRFRNLALLSLIVVMENFGYRQLNTWWRLLGLYRWATQREAIWGEMTRKGVGQQQKPP